MNKEEWAEIAAELKEWRRADIDQLCSAFSVPGPKYVDNIQAEYRYRPGVSFTQVMDDGEILWFVINPDLEDDVRRPEAIDMLVWIYELGREHYRGTCGQTDFSRWVWEEIGGWEPVEFGNMYKFQTDRETYARWVDSVTADSVTQDTAP